MTGVDSGAGECPFSGQTVLVTGGAGFIGGHLTASFGTDVTVRVLDDLSSGSRDRVPTRATLLVGDIRDEDDVAEAMDGVDVVFHLAAIVDVSESVRRPRHTHAVNVEGTLTVLEAARRTDTRVVLASSAAIYGRPESIPIAERDAKTPTSPYGLEKLSLDQYGQLYGDLYELPVVRLRLFNVYGPGQSGGDYSGVVSIFLEQARAEEPITVNGDGEQTRDFVHVEDVVQAFRLAGTTDQVGEAFNIGTGDSVTVRELATVIRDVTDSSSEIVHTDPREGDIRRSRADISKAKATLGYEPRVTLREGLETV